MKIWFSTLSSRNSPYFPDLYLNDNKSFIPCLKNGHDIIKIGLLSILTIGFGILSVRFLTNMKISYRIIAFITIL